MSLTDLEAHVLAYYVDGAANTLDISGRFYPHGELVMIIADKIQVATRKFGRKANAGSRAAAAAFVDHMIERGAWSTKTNDFGGTMHQFQGDAYKAALKALQESDPAVADLRTAADPAGHDRRRAGVRVRLFGRRRRSIDPWIDQVQPEPRDCCLTVALVASAILSGKRGRSAIWVSAR